MKCSVGRHVPRWLLLRAVMECLRCRLACPLRLLWQVMYILNPKFLLHKCNNCLCTIKINIANFLTQLLKNITKQLTNNFHVMDNNKRSLDITSIRDNAATLATRSAPRLRPFFLQPCANVHALLVLRVPSLRNRSLNSVRSFSVFRGDQYYKVKI